MSTPTAVALWKLTPEMGQCGCTQFSDDRMLGTSITGHDHDRHLAGRRQHDFSCQRTRVLQRVRFLQAVSIGRF